MKGKHRREGHVGVCGSTARCLHSAESDIVIMQSGSDSEAVHENGDIDLCFGSPWTGFSCPFNSGHKYEHLLRTKPHTRPNTRKAHLLTRLCVALPQDWAAKLP